MKIIKVLVLGLAVLFIGSAMFFSGTVSAQFTETKKVNMYFFWGDGCPHCKDEIKFLVPLMKKYPNLNIYDFETWKNKDNHALMTKVSKTMEITEAGVPLTIIGDKYVMGYGSDETTGKVLEERIQECLKDVCTDQIGEVIGNAKKTPNQISLESETSGASSTGPMASDVNSWFNKVPFIGTASTLTLSVIGLVVVCVLVAGVELFRRKKKKKHL